MYRSHSRVKPLPYDLPQVPVMLGASDVLYALGTQAAWNNKAYAFAILHSYVRGKQVRGKTNNEIHYKLEMLEVQVPPHFAVPFVEVRDYFGMRKSNVFRVVQRSATTASHASTATSSRTSNLSRATTSTGVSSRTQALANTASARPDTVRAAEDGDEPPPPPYAAEDPDPESTRILQEQLAVAAANTRNSSEYEMPLDNEAEHHRTDSTSSFNVPTPSTGVTGDAPRPNDFPASPAARVGSQHQNSPPEASTPPVTAPVSRANLSDEERRALEASELDEAMRASRQAEKERLAYEAAIQASIASAEEDSFRRSVQDSLEDTPGAGPSSSTSYPAGPSSGGGMHRRTASYNHQPSVGFGAPAIQRAASSTGTMPGTYGANVNKETPPLPPHPSTQQDDSLSDMFGSINFEAPTLQPTPTGQGKGKGRATDLPTPMQTQQTGTSRFGSKNPFLTSEERERQQQAEMDAEAAAAAGRATGATTPPPVPGRPARLGNTPSPRAPDRALPPPPAEAYASPTGAPPGWGLHASPTGPPPGWQSPPQLTLTTPSRNGTLNAGEGQGQFSTFSPVTGPSPADRASRPLPRPTGERQSVPGPDFVNPIGGYGSYAAGAAGTSPDHSDSESSGSGWSMDGTPEASPVAATPALPAVTPVVPSHPTPSTPPAVPPHPASSMAVAPLVPERSAARAPSLALIMDEAGENALEMLAEYDTVFLIDDSTSMAGERWAQAQRAIVGVVKQAVRYDRNGIDVHFLNSKRVGKGLRAPEDVEDLFAGLQPRGATPTGLRMEAILRDYMSRLERAVANGTPEDVQAMNLIVVTDGAFACPVIRRIRQLESNPHPMLDRAAILDAAPTDDPESVLVSIARRLDRGDFPLSQVGVQLLQIGDDAEAREALQELDDGLAAAHGVRDMVDTVPFTGEALTSDLIVKVLLGGINRRLDRRG